MNILTWTVGFHSIFQFVPVTSEVGGGHCGINKWGPACVKNCPSNCRPLHVTVHCQVNTGECLEGCNVGYHGSYCRRQCNPNCINNTCNQVDGECSIGCTNGTSCIETSPPTNKSDTDITQTQCDVTSCLGYSVSFVIVTVILCALSGLFVLYCWRRHQMGEKKRVNQGPAGEPGEMNRLDTAAGDSD